MTRSSMAATHTPHASAGDTPAIQIRNAIPVIRFISTEWLTLRVTRVPDGRGACGLCKRRDRTNRRVHALVSRQASEVEVSRLDAWPEVPELRGPGRLGFPSPCTSSTRTPLRLPRQTPRRTDLRSDPAHDERVPRPSPGENWSASCLLLTSTPQGAQGLRTEQIRRDHEYRARTRVRDVDNPEVPPPTGSPQRHPRALPTGSILHGSAQDILDLGLADAVPIDVRRAILRVEVETNLHAASIRRFPA